MGHGYLVAFSSLRTIIMLYALICYTKAGSYRKDSPKLYNVI